MFSFVQFFELTLTALFVSLYLLNRKSGDSSGSRQIRNTPDWSDNAVAGDHLWVSTSVSGDCCYIGDNDCTVSSFTPCSSLCVLFLIFHEKGCSHEASHEYRKQWFSVNINPDNVCESFALNELEISIKSSLREDFGTGMLKDSFSVNFRAFAFVFHLKCSKNFLNSA